MDLNNDTQPSTSTAQLNSRTGFVTKHANITISTTNPTRMTKNEFVSPAFTETNQTEVDRLQNESSVFATLANSSFDQEHSFDHSNKTMTGQQNRADFIRNATLARSAIYDAPRSHHEFDTSPDRGIDSFVLHVSVGAVSGAVIIIFLVLISLVWYKFHRTKTSNNKSLPNLHDNCWDDISLNYIDNPNNFGARDSLDDIASMDNDSYLNSLDQLMFQRWIRPGCIEPSAVSFRNHERTGVPDGAAPPITSRSSEPITVSTQCNSIQGASSAGSGSPYSSNSYNAASSSQSLVPIMVGNEVRQAPESVPKANIAEPISTVRKNQYHATKVSCSTQANTLSEIGGKFSSTNSVNGVVMNTVVR